MEISQKGDQVTIQDKENKVTISQKISQKDFGAPIYPGAKLGENSSMMMQQNGNKHLAAGIFFTSDPVDKVVTFYRNQLPSAKFGQVGDNWIITVESEEKPVTVVVRKQGQDEEETGKTSIAITSEKI